MGAAVDVRAGAGTTASGQSRRGRDGPSLLSADLPIRTAYNDTRHATQVSRVLGFVDPVVAAIIQRDLDKHETAGTMILHLTKFASDECARECVEAILGGDGVLEGAPWHSDQ